jgi:hypothetical protein
VLNHPEPNETFILDTDASDKSIGAELSQIQDGVEKTVSFASEVLTPQQRKYCTLINMGIRNFLRKDQCISHEKICKKGYLFRDDGVHLSDVGNDYLLEDIQSKIKRNTLFS